MQNTERTLLWSKEVDKRQKEIKTCLSEICHRSADLVQENFKEQSSTKCWRITVKWLRKLLHVKKFIYSQFKIILSKPFLDVYLTESNIIFVYHLMREPFSLEIMQTGWIPTGNSEQPVHNFLENQTPSLQGGIFFVSFCLRDTKREN